MAPRGVLTPAVLYSLQIAAPFAATSATAMAPSVEHESSNLINGATSTTEVRPQDTKYKGGYESLSSTSSAVANDEDAANTKAGGSFWGSVFNLLNAAIGAGVLALPSCIQSTGLILGMLVAISLAMLLYYSLHIIGKCNVLAQEPSYHRLVSRVLGPRAGNCLMYLQFANAFGSCIAFLVICANQLEPVLSEVPGVTDSTSIFERRALITVVVSCICLPMLYIDSVAPLEPLATFSVVAIQFLVIAILWGTLTQLQSVGHFPHLETVVYLANQFVTQDPDEHLSPDGGPGRVDTAATPLALFVLSGGAVGKAVSMLCFAYNMHPTYPMVFDELRPTSEWYATGDRQSPRDISKWTQGALRKMDYATIASLCICFVTYMIVGAAGTFFCASKQIVVPGDILQAFPSGIMFHVARICVAISVVGSYATNHFVGLECFKDLVYPQSIPAVSEAADEEQPVSTTWSDGGSIQAGDESEVLTSPWIARLHPVIFLPMTAYLSLVIPSITTIVAFTGALTVVPFMFVFPGLLLLHVQKAGLAFIKPSRHSSGSFLKPWHRAVVGYAFIVGGVAVSILSVCVTISDMNTSHGQGTPN